MLIPERAAEEIHLSGVFIYAGHTFHADSCLALTVGFWSCSSLLLHGAIKWCEKAEWCFSLLSPQGDTVDLFSASSWEALMLAQVRSVLPTHMSVRGMTTPCQARLSDTSGSFWNDWNRSLTFFGPCSLAKVSTGYLGLFWDQDLSMREYRLNAIYHDPFPRLPEPLLVCPMP